MFLDELSHCKIWIQTTSCAVIIQLASWESLCTSSFVRRNVSQNPQFDLWVYCGQNADIHSTVRARMFRGHGTDVLRSGHRRSVHWYLQCIPQILTGLYTLLVMCAKVQVFHFHFSLWWFSGSATYAVFLYKLVQIGTYVLQLALCGGGGVWFCMTSYISKRYGRWVCSCDIAHEGWHPLPGIWWLSMYTSDVNYVRMDLHDLTHMVMFHVHCEVH